MPLQQLHKIKGVADVVFVLDTSGSMGHILDAVKTHIGRFVSGVQSGQQSIDLRLGLVLHPEKHGERRLIKSFPFTSDPDVFLCHLASATSYGNEFQLPGFDAALDFPWRSQSRRLIVFFSDEPVSGGENVALQRKYRADLIDKICALHVHGYLIGPACRDYDAICQQGNGFRRVVVAESEMEHYSFADLLASMGKTVSVMSEQDAPVKYRQNLYGI